MFLSKTNPKYTQLLLFIGCVLVIIGLLFSKAILSLSTAYLILLYILLGNYSVGFKQIKQNKSILFFTVFIGFYILSIAWSEQIMPGFTDILSKCNLILLPLVIVALPAITTSYKLRVLQLFAGLVFIESCINFSFFQLNFSPDKDIRTMSLFISHIRFALFVVFALFILAFQKKTSFSVKIIIWLSIAWLLFYTYYAQVLSGILSFIVCLLVLIILGFKNTNKWMRFFSYCSLITIIFAAISGVVLYQNASGEKINIKSYPKYTKLGHLYFHDTTSNAQENGFPLDCFINEQELDSTWKTRSNIELNTKTKNGFMYHTVLLRYLTSKGLTKDAEGINKLTYQDIKNIELGIPSILNLKTGLQNRINELHHQWNSLENPNGHSILQRLEYWKTGLFIFKNNWFVGTGIGDYKQAYQKEYDNLDSPLEHKYRLESHNQFLGIAIATGSIGLLLFIIFLIHTFQKFWLNKEVIPILFLSICIASFLVEDTLTTLAGMSFFSFFMGIFNTKNVDTTS